MARPYADIATRSRPAAKPAVAERIATGQPAPRRLDAATALGLLGAFALIAAALAVGGRPHAFVDLPSLLIVVGGTFAVTTISFSLREVANAQRVVFKTLVNRIADPEAASLDILRFAESARKNGVLALEPELSRMQATPYLAKGFGMAVDGATADEIERVMRRELHAIQTRHARSAGVLRRAAEVAPAMGLIGTLIGLVQMLGALDDPASIGPGMAVALITTFYGVLLATLVFSPLAAKLERNSFDEALLNQIYLLGCTSIARQENPRRLEMQLNALLPPAQRIHYFT